MLTRAKASELTLDHDTHLGTKGFGLLHRMSRENYGTLFPQSRDIRDDSPHEALCLRVDTSAWFIEKHDGRVSNQGDSTLQLAFIATGKSSCIDICEVG